MIGTDVLLTSAELALALGGFGGVVAAFMGNRERWNPMAIVRFRALIAISLGAAFLALLPLPLHFGGFDERALWSTASSIAGAIVGIFLVVMLIYARRPMVTHGSPLWSLIALVMATGSVAVNVLNALGIGFSQSLTGYFSALLVLLVLAGLYFFRLIVLSGPQPESRDQAG